MHYALSYKAHIRYHTALFCHLSGRAWVTFGDSPLTTAHWLPFFCRYFFNVEWVRRSSCAPLIAVFIASQIHFGFQPSKLRNEAGEPPKLSQTNSRQTRTHRNILAPTDRWGCQKLPRGEFWVLLTGPRPKVWVQLITWGGVRWIGGAGDSLWTAPPTGCSVVEALNWATRRPEADGCDVWWCHHLLLPFGSETARVGAMWQTPSQAQTLASFVRLFQPH